MVMPAHPAPQNCLSMAACSPCSLMGHPPASCTARCPPLLANPRPSLVHIRTLPTCSNAARMAGVDLEMERRQERSQMLRSRLLELAPALERLAVPPGGGRAQQMLARLKAL